MVATINGNCQDSFFVGVANVPKGQGRERPGDLVFVHDRRQARHQFGRVQPGQSRLQRLRLALGAGLRGGAFLLKRLGGGGA